MYLTYHGNSRLHERSKLAPDDVLMLVKHQVYVKLGERDSLSFLLFYSLPDKTAKIVIVSNDSGGVVSVWDKDYLLPQGVLPVTLYRINEAKKLFKKFVFEQKKLDLSLAQAKENKSLADREPRHIYFAVIVKGKMEYKSELKSIPYEQTQDSKSIVTYFSAELRKIVDAVNSFEGVKSRLRYELRMKSLSVPNRVSCIVLRPKVLHGYLENLSVAP